MYVKFALLKDLRAQKTSRGPMFCRPEGEILPDKGCPEGQNRGSSLSLFNQNIGKHR
jgi:hypothetical protein